MKSCFVAFLLVCTSTNGSAQTFKGNHIGETVAQFVQVQPTLSALVEECKDTTPKLLTDDQVLKKYGKKKFPAIQKAEAQAVASGHHVQGYFDTDTDVYGDKCGALITLATTGSGTVNGKGYVMENEYAQHLEKRQWDDINHASPWRTPVLPPRPAMKIDYDTFTFANGVLDHFTLFLPQSYEAIRDDVTQRVGVQPKVSTTPYQNGYGARWDDITNTWVTNSVVVTLYADGNPVKKDLLSSLNALTVGSREYMKKLIEQMQNKPKPLD